MSKYRLTCLSPLLVGDGQKLSPIDYMVWKNQINVLDQKRIFRLLSKGPRLDGYLTQIRKADKLDFASWGGFAQNFAGRRIPFEHPSSTDYWNKARLESLSIPTFASGPGGLYLPGSAVKGVLRTGYLFSRYAARHLEELAARLEGDRPVYRPAEVVESAIAGSPGYDRMRSLSVSDSDTIPEGSTQIYLLRVATLTSRGGKLGLGWKTGPRGTADGSRPDDGTPLFAEMAAPGTCFEGTWRSSTFLEQPEILRALHWKESPGRARVVETANSYAAVLLDHQKRYAATAGLTAVLEQLKNLEGRLEQARLSGSQCLVCFGWGIGYLAKTLQTDTNAAEFRALLQALPHYPRAFEGGLPFPKTRKIVFLENRPAALPGWALVEFLDSV